MQEGLTQGGQKRLEVFEGEERFCQFPEEELECPGDGVDVPGGVMEIVILVWRRKLRFAFRTIIRRATSRGVEQNDDESSVLDDDDRR